MRQATNLVGRSFGRLTVRSHAEVGPEGGRYSCACACGGSKVVSARSLLSGHCKSCGCLHREVSAAMARAKVKHGASVGGTTSPEYNAWQGMRQRVLGRDDTHRRRYADRGIAVCARWLRSFEAFLADVGPRPSPAHSLDRYPNRDGNYEPGNVRWATAREQAANRATTVMLTIAGVTKPLVEWARDAGLIPSALKWRVEKGWPDSRLLEASRKRSRSVNHDREMKNETEATA